MNEFSRQFGGVKTEVATAATRTGRIFAFQCVTEVTVSAFIASRDYVVTGLAGATLPVGTLIYGDFASLSFTGTVVLYYASTLQSI